MNKNLLYLGVVALAVVAIFFGYKIYEQQMPRKATNTPAPQNNNSATTSARTSQRSSNPVLDFPGSTATKDEMRKFSERVTQAAKDTDTLNIANCSPDPVVLRTKVGSNIKVYNADNVVHEIVVNPEHKYTINSKETKTIKTDFGRGFGVYGFLCDKEFGQGSPVGIFQLIQ